MEVYSSYCEHLSYDFYNHLVDNIGGTVDKLQCWRALAISFEVFLLMYKGLVSVAARDEDPDPYPVGTVDFWHARAGSGTFFNGSGSYL